MWEKEADLYASEPNFPLAMEAFRAAVQSGADASDAMDWLIAIAERVENEIPPLTLADWPALASWWKDNRDRIPHHPKYHGCADVSGRPVDLNSIEVGVREGPRTSWGARHLVMVRQLRQEHGEQVADRPPAEVTA